MSDYIIYILHDESSGSEFVLRSPFLCCGVVPLDVFRSLYLCADGCKDLVSNLLQYRISKGVNYEIPIFSIYGDDITKSKDSLHVLVQYNFKGESSCLYLIHPPEKVSVLKNAEDALKRYVDGNIVSVFSKDCQIRIISNDGLLRFLESMTDTIKNNDLFVINNMDLN